MRSTKKDTSMVGYFCFWIREKRYDGDNRSVVRPVDWTARIRRSSQYASIAAGPN